MFEAFCTDKNIEPIYAPANDHRERGPVERLIQTIKRQLSCRKAHPNKKFNREHAIHAIIQKLRITNQKTTNITPFEAHFGRQFNTPVSNITKKSNSKDLIYNKITKYYLDKDTIHGRSYFTDEQWADTGMCTDVEKEKVICAANARAHEEQQKMKDEEARLIKLEGISRPIPRSERCNQVKIAKKIHAARRQKKNLDRHYEFWLRGAQLGRSTQQPVSLQLRYRQIWHKR